MPAKVFKHPKTLTLKIKSVVLVTSRGPDRVALNFSDEVPSTYSDGLDNSDHGSAGIRLSAGKGLDWCKEVLGLKESEIDIVKVSAFKTNFSRTFGSKPRVK